MSVISPHTSVAADRDSEPSSPVKKSGSPYGFLFSVQGKLEGFGQVQRSLVQRQVVARSPQVQYVPLEPAIRLEALKDALAQMDGESPLQGRGLTVYGAGTTALLPTSTQAREEAQVL